MIENEVRDGAIGREVLEVIEELGWEVNLYGVPDLEAFLEAALLLPTLAHSGLQLPGMELLRTRTARPPAHAWNG